eukprot:6209806-Pleurochrysis_carterae.AAC.1
MKPRCEVETKLRLLTVGEMHRQMTRVMQDCRFQTDSVSWTNLAETDRDAFFLKTQGMPSGSGVWRRRLGAASGSGVWRRL